MVVNYYLKNKSVYYVTSWYNWSVTLKPCVPSLQPGKKVLHILDIWAGGMGVVSLHCFQNVIPVEAYTREACMMDAIGKRGSVEHQKGSKFAQMYKDNGFLVLSRCWYAIPSVTLINAIERFHMTLCCPPTYGCFIIPTEISIHLCKQPFTLLYVTVSPWTARSSCSSAWWSHACMVRVAALDIQVSLRNPMASLEDSVTSVKMLYNQHCFLIQYGCISDCLLCTDSNIHNDHGLSY